MCGFLVCHDYYKIRTKDEFLRVADRAKWRGPDYSGYAEGLGGAIKFSHHRLSIVDLSTKSNQPLFSGCGRYTMVYNGEIYNYRELGSKLGITLETYSDTLFLLHAYEKCGPSLLSELEGMFSFVIYDSHRSTFFAARDQLGIKPLFFAVGGSGLYFGSEASLVAQLCGASFDFESFSEWELFRHHVPGYSYFTGVQELLPGHYYDSGDAAPRSYWKVAADTGIFNQEHFESLLAHSIKSHCISDVPVVSMLSGGIDSAVITKLSGVTNSYSVGLDDNNEFAGAVESAREIGCNVRTVQIKEDELLSIWRALTKLRGEPLSVPNEGLIYSLCKNIASDEKVLLTGEGADELFFGYDKIFKWGASSDFDPQQFLTRYSYGSVSSAPGLNRFWSFVDNLRFGKKNIDFLEDFFIQFHLPTLLRRMDFATMAASKEARVPFVTTRLFQYLYRRPTELRISEYESKMPIRIAARRLGLHKCLNVPKVGFSARLELGKTRAQEYAMFQNIVKQELLWS